MKRKFRIITQAALAIITLAVGSSCTEERRPGAIFLKTAAHYGILTVDLIETHCKPEATAPVITSYGSNLCYYAAGPMRNCTIIARCPSPGETSAQAIRKDLDNARRFFWELALLDLLISEQEREK